jgi:broad-specificity NMP kinase
MPKKSIFITAVAGTGKSTLCKELNRLGYKSYDIESIPDLFTLYDHKTGGLMPNHDNSDLELVKRGNWHCDKEKLRKIIKDETAPLTFYCGAATNAKEIADLFDKIIVLSVSDSTTLKRL